MTIDVAASSANDARARRVGRRARLPGPEARWERRNRADEHRTSAATARLYGERARLVIEPEGAARRAGDDHAADPDERLEGERCD